jgi:DNA-binding protein H-NS
MPFSDDSRALSVRPRAGHRLAHWTAVVLADFVRGPAAPVAIAAAPAPVRYRHPVLGLTWDGRGVQPQWLRDAVLQEGYLLHQLRCSGPATLS